MTIVNHGVCKKCSKRFTISPSRLEKGKGVFCSMSCRRVYQRENATYGGIHGWLRRNYGTATICENKKCSKSSDNFDWALIRGNDYECKRENYIQLCRSCHVVYDGLIEALSQKRMRPIIAISTTGEKNLFPSGRDAAKLLGINSSEICAALKGKRKIVRGFTFIYA